MTRFQTSDRHQTGRSLCLIDSVSSLRINFEQAGGEDLEFSYLLRLVARENL